MEALHGFQNQGTIPFPYKEKNGSVVSPGAWTLTRPTPARARRLRFATGRPRPDSHLVRAAREISRNPLQTTMAYHDINPDKMDTLGIRCFRDDLRATVAHEAGHFVVARHYGCAHSMQVRIEQQPEGAEAVNGSTWHTPLSTEGKAFVTWAGVIAEGAWISETTDPLRMVAEALALLHVPSSGGDRLILTKFDPSNRFARDCARIVRGRWKEIEEIVAAGDACLLGRRERVFDWPFPSSIEAGGKESLRPRASS